MLVSTSYAICAGTQSVKRHRQSSRAYVSNVITETFFVASRPSKEASSHAESAAGAGRLPEMASVSLFQFVQYEAAPLAEDGTLSPAPAG